MVLTFDVNFQSRGCSGRAPNPAFVEKLLRDLSLWDNAQGPGS